MTSANVTYTRCSKYVPQYNVLLGERDTLAFLKTIPDNIIQLVVTSPPYNIGKPYEKRIELEKYLNYQLLVLRECVRTLKDEGSLCWEVGNYVESGEVFPLDSLFYRIIKEELKLKLRNRIIWKFGHGLHASRRFSGRYEVILWFTKQDEYVFNLDSIRIPQKYPGKRHYKGPKRGEFSGNPLGKNPSDIWTILSSDWNEEIWDIPNVKYNHIEKTIHPAQFPIELVERLVLALTNPGDILLDPFMGVGSSILAAILHARNAIGVENNSSYIDIAIERIEAHKRGLLKKRPLGKPIYEPNGNEKVSQKPAHWVQTPKGETA